MRGLFRAAGDAGSSPEPSAAGEPLGGLGGRVPGGEREGAREETQPGGQERVQSWGPRRDSHVQGRSA